MVSLQDDRVEITDKIQNGQHASDEEVLAYEQENGNQTDHDPCAKMSEL